MLIYKVDSYDNKITEIEAERETESSFWFKDYPTSKKASRHAKVSGYGRYFISWEDSHAYLKERAEERLAYAIKARELAELDARKVFAMVKHR